VKSKSGTLLAVFLSDWERVASTQEGLSHRLEIPLIIRREDPKDRADTVEFKSGEGLGWHFYEESGGLIGRGDRI
jgi:hypothetical protein